MPVQSRLAPTGHLEHAPLSVFKYIVSTYNLNGLSAYSNSARNYCIVANIRALAVRSHVIVLQETHLNFDDNYSLEHVLPGWLVFYSNYSKLSGGVATLISPAIHLNCNITVPHVNAMHQGRILPLLITPISCPTNNVLLLNLYLPTGEGHYARLAAAMEACCLLAPAK